MARSGFIKKAFIIICIAILMLLYNISNFAIETATLLLTSNLEGRFIPEIADQETKDPMCLMGQSIMMESQHKKIYYFDLGNAFYTGI